MSIEFVFTEEQRQACIEEAERRWNCAHSNGHVHNDWDNRDSEIYMDLIGAAGEMAVAVYLGMRDQLLWNRRPQHASFDLPGIDVKTRRFHRYDLIVHGDERIDHKTFWLVTIENTLTLIHGWLPGPEIMQNRQWLRPMGKRQQPCYFVPKPALNPPHAWHGKLCGQLNIFADNEFGF